MLGQLNDGKRIQGADVRDGGLLDAKGCLLYKSRYGKDYVCGDNAHCIRVPYFDEDFVFNYQMHVLR